VAGPASPARGATSRAQRASSSTFAEVSTEVAERLVPLTCAACGASVALADADHVRCAHCGASVEIPQRHREALATAREDAAARTAAQDLYAKLGAPPWYLRAIGVAFDPTSLLTPLRASRLALLRAIGWYYSAVLFLCAPLVALLAAMFVVNFTMRGVGAFHHENVMDTLPSSTRDLLQIPAALGAMLAGGALAVYGRRRAVDRHKLQAALAARPPDHEGGASACRLCGAPLTIPADALGVSCVYCGADNLVAIPAAWVTALGADVVHVEKEIEAAASAHAAEEARVKRQLFWRVGVVGVALGGLFTFAIVIDRSHPTDADHVPASWPAYAARPRRLARRDAEPERHLLASRVTPIDFAPGCPAGAKHVAVPRADCEDGPCVVRLYAALRDGQRATLTLAGAPQGTHVRVEQHAGWPWPKSPNDPFGARVADLAPSAAGVATFEARWSTWYELAIVLPTSTPPAALSACFDVR
jgi:DNA-directed RNA polymerase subunit RPC12/RpoP